MKKHLPSMHKTTQDVQDVADNTIRFNIFSFEKLSSLHKNSKINWRQGVTCKTGKAVSSIPLDAI